MKMPDWKEIRFGFPKMYKMRREWNGYDMEMKTKAGNAVVIENPGVKQKAFIENWQAFKEQPYRPFHHLLDVRTESYRWGPYWSAHVWVPIEVLTVGGLLWLLV